MITMLQKLKQNPGYVLRRVLNDPREAIKAAQQVNTSGDVGCREARMEGWYSYDTGELCRGFPITTNDTVVDVGCGDGNNSVFCAMRGAQVIATDIDPEKVEMVEKKLNSAKGKQHRAICSDSNPLPLEDGSVSRVIAMEVMEHVEEPPKFLAELARVAKQDALLLITVPDANGESVQKHVAPSTYWEKPNHLHIFQRDEFAGLVEGAGLKIEHRAHRCFFWAMWWALFWAADQEFGEPDVPLLKSWAETWNHLLDSPNGGPVRKALNEFMPKDQVIVARKAA